MMAKKLPSYSNTLPEDLWFDILCRLSVVSLLRCRCVCKTWHHIIGTCSFVKTHVAYQNSSSSNKYMLYDSRTLCELFRDFKSLSDVTKHSKLYYTMKSFGRSYYSVKIYGVCNGLLCLSDKDYCIAKDIYLWNPICRKIKKLPRLKFDDEATRREIKTFRYFEIHKASGLSFGYYDDDYKVIVVYPIQEEQFRIIVSIYSLGTNSWKIVCTNYFLGKEYDKCNYFEVAKFVNGTAYMLASTYPIQSVICFSLSDETVRVIKAPREFDAPSVNIEAYGETIAVLGSYDQSGFDYLDMYILRSNESLSWETKFSVKLQKYRCRRWTFPLGFSNNGKYIVRTIDFAKDSSSRVVKLFWCDLDSAKLTALKLRKQLVHDSRFGLVEARIHSNCTESLLLLNEDSLDPYEHVDMELSCSSVLFTLDNRVERANTLSLYGGKKETYK